MGVIPVFVFCVVWFRYVSVACRRYHFMKYWCACVVFWFVAPRTRNTNKHLDKLLGGNSILPAGIQFGQREFKRRTQREFNLASGNSMFLSGRDVVGTHWINNRKRFESLTNFEAHQNTTQKYSEIYNKLQQLDRNAKIVWKYNN